MLTSAAVNENLLITFPCYSFEEEIWDLQNHYNIKCTKLVSFNIMQALQEQFMQNT